MTTTKLDDIHHEVNCAALEAIDAVLAKHFGPEVKILDRDLPKLLPHIQAATEAAMRRFYDLLPESLNVDPAYIAKTTEQLARARGA